MNIDQFNGHTPGPWDYEYGPMVSDHEDDADVLVIMTPPTFDEGKAWANQQLAAAAPDLLATLIKTQKELAVYHQWASYVSAFVNSNASDEMYHYLECLMVEAGVMCKCVLLEPCDFGCRGEEE